MVGNICGANVMMSQRKMPSSPSILMVTSHYYPFLGGLERQAHMLGRALVRLGCRVTVITGRSEPDMARHERLDGVEVWRLPTHMTSAWRRGATFVASLPFVMTVLAGRYDVVHAHSISWFLAGCIPVARLWRRPCLVKIPSFGEFGISGLLRRRSGDLLLRLLRKAQTWVALAENIRTELIVNGFPRERVFTVFNGVDTALYHPVSLETGRELRSTLGLSPKRPLVIYAGRLSPEKGLLDLLDVWPHVQRKTESNPELLICGDGPQREQLETVVRKGSLTSVTFAGSIRNPAPYYQVADLFVLPSYVEGNSNSLLEAMACGLAALTTRVGGSADMLGNYPQDFLIDPGDRRALASGMIQLLNDKSLRSRLGLDLAKRVAALYSIERIAEHYLQCYRMLLAGHTDQIGKLHYER